MGSKLENKSLPRNGGNAKDRFFCVAFVSMWELVCNPTPTQGGKNEGFIR